MLALDLFCGTGWGVACERLGIKEWGVDNAKAVIATRRANGMRMAFEDVWSGLYRTMPIYDLLIASPPCQTFSMAGSGAGRQALDQVLQLVREGADQRPDDLRAFARERGDERTALVLAPLAYAVRDQPRFIVFEQVPPVLPVWEACAAALSTIGYSTWTGILHAEQYGVPQTRRRAILIARRDGVPAAPPAPTHSRYYPRDPQRLDPGVLPWASMAAALDREDSLRSNYGTGGDPAARGIRLSEEPAATVTSKADRNRWVFNDQSGTSFDHDWPSKRPATVLAGRDLIQNPGAPANRFNGSTKSRNDGIAVTAQEAAVLQSYPADFEWVGTKTETFRQIGNAVPPLLAEAILRNFV